MSKINYDLLKKLKDAKFPSLKDIPDVYLIENEPVLSELIEACGESFGRLDHVQMEGIEPIWVAYSSRIENEINVPAYIVQQGPTPEEAVTNLWLAQNPIESQI